MIATEKLRQDSDSLEIETCRYKKNAVRRESQTINCVTLTWLNQNITFYVFARDIKI